MRKACADVPPANAHSLVAMAAAAGRPASPHIRLAMADAAAVPRARENSLLSAAAIAFALLLLFGCSGNNIVPGQNAVMPVVQKCQLKCSMTAKTGTDMSPGPCLGIIADDWVCDVAHSPRIPADDLPENQCPDFREGRAHHFAEVTPDCRFIREA
ncbi:MAG: hypothetical protein NTX79_07620 [Candidatus Micrarchaeota archaeon]|nr:hypothetical protein [Candidatus Micrarchaeota archaeon]